MKILWKLINHIRGRTSLVLAEADEMMETFGDRAYFEARKLRRDAMRRRDARKERFYAAVAREIAKRTDFTPGVDTATRYLERPPAEPDRRTLH